MRNIFNGSEIVEIGIQIEKNGKDYYDTLVSKSKNEEAKEVFKYLSGEEARHISDFQKLLDSVEKYEPPESYTGEFFAYMSALAGEHIFTQENKGIEVANSVTDDKEAIELAIEFEKDSIIFYEGMKKVVPNGDINLVESLILQEQKHLCKLTELKTTF